MSFCPEVMIKKLEDIPDFIFFERRPGRPISLSNPLFHTEDAE
jgi:hypothetical protein